MACKQWNELPAPLGHNVTEFSGSLQSPMDLNGDTRLIQTFHEEESGNKFQPINWAIGRRSCMHCTTLPASRCARATRCSTTRTAS